jgi:hypothetical protein
MQTALYRIFVGGSAISQDMLDKVDTVTVEQEMDQTWYATLEILICTTEKGKWEGEDDSLIKPFKQVRIEISIDNKKTWVPLIDGPVVGFDSSLSPEPSQSTMSVRVADDSIRLWRKDETKRWTGSDSDIARQIFQDNNLSDTKIDTTDPGTSDRPAAIMQRGTALETLHCLAERHAFMHAWVAAGDSPGKSVGMFKKEDSKTSGLPALSLLGADRNMDEFTSTNDQQRPANVTHWQLDLTDLSIKKGNVKYSDLTGKDDPIIGSDDIAELVVPPSYGCSGFGIDPQELAKRWAAQYAVALEAHGRVRSKCYAGVLQPYKMVEVKSVNGKLSGNYVIRSVKHTLTRSEYSQDFSLLRRGQSAGADAANPSLPVGNII